MKRVLCCDWCGKSFEKEICRITPHNFCSRACLGAFSSRAKNPDGYKTLKGFGDNSARMSEMNRQLNPTRMTAAVKAKLRKTRLGTGEGKGYSKMYGRAAHRVVAEQKLGRALLPGEVVHHIDGDKQNNSPENIVVFPSQAEHARHHAELRRRAKGGDPI